MRPSNGRAQPSQGLRRALCGDIRHATVAEVYLRISLRTDIHDIYIGCKPGYRNIPLYYSAYCTPIGCAASIPDTEYIATYGSSAAKILR